MLPTILFAEAGQVTAAILALADGTVFRGVSIGADGHCTAEIVFNTLMSGHQEVITDPSYSGQIVAFTYPHIGSTGVNTEDSESPNACISGLVVRDCPQRVSNFRATGSLPDYLKEQGVVAISGIDTRKLTRILRDGGKQGACILVGDDVDRALALAREFSVDSPAIKSSVETATAWTQGGWRLDGGYTTGTAEGPHVVAVDFGVRRSALRILADRGCRVTIVPAATSIDAIRDLQPDGIFLSSGPGDPSQNEAAIALCKQLLDTRLPLFGAGYGHQLIALAAGAGVCKLKTGHHGGNHPVRQVDTGQVIITSQKQDFAVDADTLPANLQVTHVSLFDGSVQGVQCTDAPAFGFQGFPEASPGPRDAATLFDKFIRLMAEQD